MTGAMNLPRVANPNKINMLGCSAADCTRQARVGISGQPLCSRHHHRWAAYGGTDLPARFLAAEGLCTADGCGRPVRSRHSAYCETHYYRLRRSSSSGLAPIATTCVNCGQSLVRNQTRFCSTKCNWRHQQGVPLRRQCACCGNFFEPIRHRVTCSTACREELDSIQRRAAHARRMKDPEKRARFLAGMARRRVRLAGATVEVFSPEEIFDRDGWRCGLCSKRVDKRLKWPHPRSASLDHIVPIVEGGEHSRLNTQCSHLVCNLRKNAGPGGQLRLLP